MEKKIQGLFISGANAYKTYGDFLDAISKVKIDLNRETTVRWNKKIQERLGNDYQIIRVDMPNRDFADYQVWKMWFEKYLEVLQYDLVLIGHSMGGVFLAKYLSENKIDKNITGLFLVAPPSTEEEICTFRLDLDVLPNLENSSKNIHIYFSEDDPIVTISNADNYRKALPNAHIHVFKDKGHFSVEEFPELINDIKNT